MNWFKEQEFALKWVFSPTLPEELSTSKSWKLVLITAMTFQETQFIIFEADVHQITIASFTISLLNIEIGKLHSIIMCIMNVM